jgi:hypothetical protein
MGLTVPCVHLSLIPSMIIITCTNHCGGCKILPKIPPKFGYAYHVAYSYCLDRCKSHQRRKIRGTRDLQNGGTMKCFLSRFAKEKYTMYIYRYVAYISTHLQRYRLFPCLGKSVGTCIVRIVWRLNSAIAFFLKKVLVHRNGDVVIRFRRRPGNLTQSL